MTEFFFYHLIKTTPKQILPDLLKKCLKKNWRVVIQIDKQERLEEIDLHLWTYSDESFIPHSSILDGNEKNQPIWLTTGGDDNPNYSEVRFLVNCIQPIKHDNYIRIIYIFEDRIYDAVCCARQRWQAEKESMNKVNYWQQTVMGKWEKK